MRSRADGNSVRLCDGWSPGESVFYDGAFDQAGDGEGGNGAGDGGSGDWSDDDAGDGPSLL